MAQGQTTRNNLSMRNPADIEGSLREIKRWADRIPIGSSGFHAYSTTNQVIGAGAGANLTFDTMVRNKEGWKPPGATFTSFVVPRGLSGVYSLNAEAYWGPGSFPAVLLIIQVNGLSIVNSPNWGAAGAAAEEVAVAITYPLKERDIITLRVLNASGIGVTSTNFTGNVNLPPSPFLSAWRISLL